MRISPYFILFGLCGSLFAEEADLQESNQIIAPQRGIYAGLGLVASNDKYDFALNSCGDTEGYYKTTDYRRTQRSYNGQLFIGYQIVTPIFAALELSYTLNKGKSEKVYNGAELPGANDYATYAHLSMKYGNDLSLKLKIGKSFSIGIGNSCRHVTPYIVLGMHERSIDASFDYIVPSKGAAGLGVDDFSFGNHKMKGRKLGFIWGLGASMAFEKAFSIGVEYNCRKMRSLHDQRTIKNPPVGNPLDEEGKPRYYSINGKNSHSLTIWLSKNISFE